MPKLLLSSFHANIYINSFLFCPNVLVIYFKHGRRDNEGSLGTSSAAVDFPQIAPIKVEYHVCFQYLCIGFIWPKAPPSRELSKIEKSPPRPLLSFASPNWRRMLGGCCGGGGWVGLFFNYTSINLYLIAIFSFLTHNINFTLYRPFCHFSIKIKSTIYRSTWLNGSFVLF